MFKLQSILTRTAILLLLGQVPVAARQQPSQGTISGRVFDEDGKPAIGAPVEVLRLLPNVSGTYQSVGTARADDRGEYRLKGIQPGRYYLTVGTGGGGTPVRPAVGTSSSTTYAFQAFPGVDSMDQAVPFDLQAGTELSLDMKTHLQRTFRVRGTVIESETGRPPMRLEMKLSYKNSAGVTRTDNIARDYDPTTGEFEILNVVPGSYVLQAQTQVMDEASRAAGEAAWSMFPTARVPITLIDADLENVALIQRRPAAVQGRVRGDGLFDAGATLRSATFRLTPVAEGSSWLPPTAFVQPDGVFRVDGILEAEYSVSFGGAPRGFYVASIQYAGADILNQRWRLSGTVSGTIEVVLRQGSVAQLAGVVMDARSRPVSGAQVVLLPEQRGRRDLYRFAIADQSGRFAFSEVTPGDYKLFSWESIAPVPYSNPDFIKSFEEQGRLIQAAESSNADVNLRVIPIP